jgi:hypothetical protein
MKLSFGVHKGKSLADVPLDYLTWLVEQPKLWDETRAEIRAELATDRRKAEMAQLEQRKKEEAINRAEAYAGFPSEESDSRNTLRRSKKQVEAEKRLTKAGWIRSNRGYWSKDFPKTKTRPGWCLYQVSWKLALLVHDYLNTAALTGKAKAQTKAVVA